MVPCFLYIQLRIIRSKLITKNKHFSVVYCSCQNFWKLLCHDILITLPSRKLCTYHHQNHYKCTRPAQCAFKTLLVTWPYALWYHTWELLPCSLRALLLLTHHWSKAWSWPCRVRWTRITCKSMGEFFTKCKFVMRMSWTVLVRFAVLWSIEGWWNTRTLLQL